jgi:hypothetical protein
MVDVAREAGEEEAIHITVDRGGRSPLLRRGAIVDPRGRNGTRSSFRGVLMVAAGHGGGEAERRREVAIGLGQVNW